MQEKPLVSIITPSYNQGKFLEETINSVLSQDYPNIEYWVIDGGSQDNSVEIIKKYAHQLAGWLSEPDGGQADAINKGFSKATGEVIAWLNSDDLYRPGAIANAVGALQDHPEVGLVYSDVYSIDERGELFNRMHYNSWQLPDLMAFNILGQPSVFFRRSALEGAGLLDLSYHYLLDHHLWLQMALATQLLYVPGQAWSSARMHPGAKNVAQAEGFGKEAYRLVEWMQKDPRFTEYFEEYKANILAGAHRINAFYLLNANQSGAALKAYKKVWKQNPSLVIKDWRRVAFALLSPFNPDVLRKIYLRKRKERLMGKENCEKS